MTVYSFNPSPLATVGCSALPVYVGPGEIVSGAVWWGGLRPYNRANGNNTQIVNLRRSSDNAASDFGFVNGLLDQAAIATFGGVSATGTGLIAGTAMTFTGGVIGGQVTGTGVTPGTCIAAGTSPNWTVNISQTVASTTLTVANALFVTTLYGQIGGANAVQVTAANQPVMLLNVLGTSLSPVLASTNGAITYFTLSISGNIVQPLTAVYLAQNNKATVQTILGDASQLRNMLGHPSANTINMSLGTGLSATATDLIAYTFVGVGNGVSSVVSILGAETAGTMNTGSAGPNFNVLTNQSAGGVTSMFLGELGFWASGFSAGERAGMTANMRAWWGV